MNQKIKLGLYVGFVLGAIIFGALFYSSYKHVNRPSESTNFPPRLSAIATNVLSQATNSDSTLFPVTVTNTLPETNPAGAINPPLETNAVATNIPSVLPPAVTTARAPTTDRSTMIGYLVAFLITAVGLGLLIAFDISAFFGNRTVDFLFNDKGTGIKNPEYEEAEQEWAKGNHLDAIRMMRDYLTENPREQYVALRIAEIYEKDLKNYLAATLEYEEILQHKLPAQRWGWAAIHLCNLYSKLGKTTEAVALLRRIVKEYGETPAAEKARQRLSTFETVGDDALSGELPESIQAPPPKFFSFEEKSDPDSNLPPGFRPKK